jgi:hypothetical protein
LKADFSDLSGEKLANDFTVALMVKPRFISPFSVRIDLPKGRTVFRSQRTEDRAKTAESEGLLHDKAPKTPILPRELEERRPSTALTNISSKALTDTSQPMRPMTSYKTYRSSILLFKARVSDMSAKSPYSALKMKVSVSDLHSVT